jgi:hypothetical protein
VIRKPHHSQNVLNRGLMSFTRFADTGVALEGQVMSRSTTSATTTAGGSTMFIPLALLDVVIPVHFGDLDKVSDPAHLSTVSISVNNHLPSNLLLERLSTVKGTR